MRAGRRVTQPASHLIQRLSSMSLSWAPLFANPAIDCPFIGVVFAIVCCIHCT